MDARPMDCPESSRHAAPACRDCRVSCQWGPQEPSGGPAGGALVWWAFLSLIVPGLVLIGTVQGLGQTLGEPAACGVGILLCLALAAMLGRWSRGERNCRQAD